MPLPSNLRALPWPAEQSLCCCAEAVAPDGLLVMLCLRWGSICLEKSSTLTVMCLTQAFKGGFIQVSATPAGHVKWSTSWRQVSTVWTTLCTCMYSIDKRLGANIWRETTAIDLYMYCVPTCARAGEWRFDLCHCVKFTIYFIFTFVFLNATFRVSSERLTFSRFFFFISPDLPGVLLDTIKFFVSFLRRHWVCFAAQALVSHRIRNGWPLLRLGG